MWPRHPTATNYPPLLLIEGERVIEMMPDQTQLTTRYTERAVRFVEKNRGRPFFLYVAHNMPHVPLHVSRKFQGKSKRGLYGDVIMEIDWSVGEIIGTNSCRRCAAGTGSCTSGTNTSLLTPSGRAESRGSMSLEIWS